MKNLVTRLNKRPKNRYDNFYDKVQKGFIKISKNKKNYIIINSNKKISENRKIILKKVNSLLSL